MRLLHTSTYEPSEFFGTIPKYAILSHRWEEEELTFQDLPSKKDSKTKGWAKVKGCCSQALKDGYEWVWVDTCCIDKSSSAELSEAINSMFKWYREAGMCYAYLSDVPPLDLSQKNVYNGTGSLPFRNSRWFTRGWTLQELLAPSEVVFYAQDWTFIESRFWIEPIILDITGIRLRDWETACIAQKMSWASTRKTTRVEDAAYCLMGIFGVNMPPLYGEGENAFLRLQNEIMRISDDESIFAWRNWPRIDEGSGLLALSPAAFRDSGRVHPLLSHEQPFDAAPFSMSNRGLRLETYIFHCSDPNWEGPVDDTYFAPLDCEMGGIDGSRHQPALYLRRLHGSQFTRILQRDLMLLDDDQKKELEESRQQGRPRTTLFIKQPKGSDTALHGPYTISITTDSLIRGGFEISKRETPSRFQWHSDIRWDEKTSGITHEEWLSTSTLGIFYNPSTTLEFSRKSSGVTQSFSLVIKLDRNTIHWNLKTPENEYLRELAQDPVLEFSLAEPDLFQKYIYVLPSGRQICVRLLKPMEEESRIKGFFKFKLSVS
jgi:hypothetical protein